MKTILVPTDFSPLVFSQMENLLDNLQEERITILFFHAFSLPSSEQDLIGAGSRPHFQVLSEQFRKSCCRLKEKYPSQLAQVGYRHLYGNGKRLLQHFLAHHQITHLFVPEGIQPAQTHARSIDVTNLLLNSGIPKLYPSREIFRLHLNSNHPKAVETLESVAS